jgi:bifunctional non-homologous end joining protein LigD
MPPAAATKPLTLRHSITGAPPSVGAVRGALPAAQAPQLATVADEPPAGAEWLSELKLDGYRLLVWIDQGRVRLVTRNGHDWTPRMPRLAARFATLGVKTALLDGELVALRQDGTPHFHDLQVALSAGKDERLFYYAFDLIHLDGWDLRACVLRNRKRLLEALSGWGEHLRYAAHVDGDATGLHQEASRLKLEGIICKRADAPYRAGRSASWLKIKCLGREEFVVLGWTPPGGSRRGIGGLALGFYDPGGNLHFAGVVGTGFSHQDLLDFREHFDALPAAQPASLLVAGEAPDRAIRWLEPALVAEVSFTAWSGEGRVRHPVFLGLREDKPARQVVMAVPDTEAPRRAIKTRAPTSVGPSRSRWNGAVPPLRRTTVGA